VIVYFDRDLPSVFADMNSLPDGIFLGQESLHHLGNVGNGFRGIDIPGAHLQQFFPGVTQSSHATLFTR